MSRFSLLPVDGGDPIPLQPGETVVGRGPLLRVSDKRVSRQHGLLENLNGQLRLKPTHLNPCFVQSSLTDDPRPLKKDTWHRLHHGEFFSLLPGQHIYEVASESGGEENTPRNSQMFEEEEDLPVSPEPDVEPTQAPANEEATLAAPSNKEEEEEEAEEEANRPDRSLNKGVTARPQEVKNDQRDDVAPPTPKKRVLPAWMMAAVSAPQAASSSSTSSSSTPKAVKRSKGSTATPTSTKRAAVKQATTATPGRAELSEEEEEEEEEMPKKKRRKMSYKEKAQPKTDVPSQQPTAVSMEVEEEAQRVSTSSESDNNNKTKNGQRTTKKTESGGSNGGSTSKPKLRTPCPYGKDCYRKNPAHFQECCHPGDTDYEDEEEEEEEDEDRPECPYGTDCYRKNPLHRKEYKHTKRPARTTRTAPKKADDDDDEDDFGDDDSFINDDSDDAGDDSDYAPPADSGDSGKEDVKRLQKEAKAFLKKRK